MNPKLLHFSGLQGDTGAYVAPPGTPRESISVLNGETPEPKETKSLREWSSRGAKGLAKGNPCDLGEAGWGVLFTEKDEKKVAEIKEALTPLLTLRRQQATRLGMGQRYREYCGIRGYREGDGKRMFLERHGATAGEVDADVMPYYLMIVGDPRDIPYEVQCMLDVERAVGRLCFATPEEYARYAERVVAAESAVRQRRAAFFAPRHPGDEETRVCVEHLVTPLVKHATATCTGWEVREILGDAASKEQLARVLGGAETPDFLFTAGHGMVFRSGDPRQLPHQGALVCREWPGPSWKGRVPTDFYFSRDDVQSTAGSLIAFFFACFSGGAPVWRSYDLKKRVATAPHPFVAGLPSTLLGGGALAVIGHVDLAWVYSFHTPSQEEPIQRLMEFQQTVEQILQGWPVGAAMEIFGRRYAALAADLSEELLAVVGGSKVPDDETSFRLWLCQDARNYIVLGDPAVRLTSAGRST